MVKHYFQSFSLDPAIPSRISRMFGQDIRGCVERHQESQPIPRSKATMVIRHLRVMGPAEVLALDFDG